MAWRIFGAIFITLLAIGPAKVYAQAAKIVGAAGDQSAYSAADIPTVGQIERLADNLDYIKHWLDIISPGAKEFKRLDDLVGFTKDIADLSLALKTDIAEHRDPTTDASHSVEALGKISLERITDPDRWHDLATLGLISESAARRVGAFSFGAGDVAAGVGTMLGQRSFASADAWEKVLDGINSTAWGILGFATSGRWDVAQAYSAAADLGAKGLRGLTRPMVEQLAAQLNGTDASLVTIWEQAQQIRKAHGQSPVSIEEFYHSDRSILDLIGAGNLAAANARLGLTSVVSTRRTTSRYRETCVNGNCSRIDLSDPSPTGSTGPLGGVKLDRPLAGAALRGIKIDATRGTIILLGERDFLARGLNMRDLAMALWLVFGPQPQDPAFSLDPDDIRHPDGAWLRARYIPDTLQGRSFGADLFAADFRLKQLSLETTADPGGKLVPWKSSVPGFQSYAEMELKEAGADTQHEQWSRFWIVADQVVEKHAGGTMLFEARMAVKARRQTPDPKSPTGLRDVETDPASLEARWAQSVTDHYDTLAAESPAFARVREMAIAVAIAKSLKTTGARIDLERIATLLNGDRTPTVARVGALSRQWQARSETPFQQGSQQGIRIETRELHLSGGVDLDFVPHAVPDNDGAARRMGQAVEAAFHGAQARSGIARFRDGTSEVEAVAVPLLLQQ